MPSPRPPTGMSERLPPPGIGLVADPGLRRVGAGRVLIGGSPLRIIRLSETGAAVVDAWLGGRALADVNSARRLARRLLDAGMLHPVVAAADPPPPVTVVVPCHADAEKLERLLPTVGAPTVVVDDASPDGTVIAAAARRHGAALIRRARNGGPGAARMGGLAEVDTDVVVFVDTDIVLPPGWWERLAPHFDDPAVVAVAPRVASVEGPTVRERYEAVHSPLDLGPSPASVGPRRRVAYVPSAVLAVRVGALRDVGGFDPDLRVGEDVDLIWRLVEAGGVVRHVPEVVAHHAPRATWWAWLRQRIGYGRSAVGLAARHGRVVAPARCSRWSAAAWGAAALGHPRVGILVAGGSAAALVPKFEGVPDAPREAARIAVWGHLHAGLGLARAVGRVWWPIVAPVAAVSRRVRRAFALALVVPAAVEWWRGARPFGPVRSVALRIVDDAAYGVGVWVAVERSRDGRALAPELTEWPGQRRAVESDTVPGS